MRKFIALLCLFFFTLFILSYCSKTHLGPSVDNSSLFFLVKRNNLKLPDSILDYAKLSYYKGGTKLYMSDFGRAINEGPYLGRDEGILVTKGIGKTSGDDNIKTYYLEYPNGTQDTLFVDYRHVDYNQAIKESCYCYWPMKEVRYNGKISVLDSNITY